MSNPKAKTTKDSKKWPYVKFLRTRNRWMVDGRTKDGGKRESFETQVEASTRAAQLRLTRQNEGGSAFDNSELKEFGWTVADAIKFALKHLRAQKASVTVEVAVKGLIDAKAAAGRSAGYCDDLGWRLAKLTTFFDKRSIGQISTGELEAFLTSLNVAAETRNTYRRDCRTLWGFAEKRGWVTINAAAKTERAKAIGKPPGILTPEEAVALLVESHDADLRAFHGIGMFSGLRVAEIKKLDWRNVDLAGGFIEVSAATSKTRSRRLVPIQDNLRAWLTPIAETAGVVVGRNLRKRHLDARKRAGITKWPENAMRHSFVSYRLAATGNAAQTALESGHDQAILFAHYRELVRPKEAARFWEIRPSAAKDNLVAFPMEAA
jgi:integrase